MREWRETPSPPNAGEVVWEERHPARTRCTMSETRTSQHLVKCRGEVRGCWRWDLAKDPTHVFHVEGCPDETCICGRLRGEHRDDE